jgi:hypothetical protein
MIRGAFFRRAFVMALIVPGLALAASVPGPCGQCERGLPCPSMVQGKDAPADHACCDVTAKDRSDSVPGMSLGRSDCDCGRPAIGVAPAVEWPQVVAGASLRTPAVVPSTQAGHPAGTFDAGRPPAPPPSPPLYLVDCSFLT